MRFYPKCRSDNADVIRIFHMPFSFTIEVQWLKPACLS